MCGHESGQKTSATICKVKFKNCKNLRKNRVIDDFLKMWQKLTQILNKNFNWLKGITAFSKSKSPDREPDEWIKVTQVIKDSSPEASRRQRSLWSSRRFFILKLQSGTK
jgi:hypothetical protein